MAMLLFIWWWFPRTWRKGVQEDIDRVDGERRARELRAAQQQEAERAAGDLEAGGDGAAVDSAAAGAAKKPFVYTAPAYTTY